MKHFLTVTTLLFASISIWAQNTISINDFKMMDHTSWKGTLTYIDYQNGKPSYVETTMQMTIEDDLIVTNLQYTYEPDKNISEKIKINRKGTFLGKQKVISKTVDEDGTVVIETFYQGKDGGKKAKMFLTYQISNDSYTVKKEVLYKGAKERIFRNRYEYTKIN